MCTSMTWSSPNHFPPTHAPAAARAERYPRLAGQNIEQIKLDLGQLHWLAASARLARRRIAPQITELPCGTGRLSACSQAAEHRPDSGHQLT